MNRRVIRIFGSGFVALGMLFVVAGPHVAQAENSVTVETLLGQVPNSEVNVHIKIKNDDAVRQFTLPIILRKWIGDAYVTAVKPVFRERLALPGGPISSIVYVNQYIQANDGTCKRYLGTDTPDLTPGYRGFKTIAMDPPGVDTTSRSIDPARRTIGYMFNRTLFNVANALPAGEDAEGSIVLQLNLNASEGCFNIDTTCVNPALHFLMVGLNNQTLADQEFHAGQVCIIRETGVKEIGATNAGVPEEYKLNQNYPNPFNAGTVIEFTNKTDGHVTLEVFNILGQHVVTLLDDYTDYGVYAIDWDGRDSRGEAVPSGMYFYRVRAADFTAVKKMVVLK